MTIDPAYSALIDIVVEALLREHLVAARSSSLEQLAPEAFAVVQDIAARDAEPAGSP